jgi:hypothetical protein
MGYNLITRRGNLKLDKFIDSISKYSKNGYFYGFRKNRVGLNNFLEVLKFSETNNDDTMSSDSVNIRIDNSEYTNTNDDVSNPSRFLLYNGKNGQFIMIKGDVEYRNFDSYTDIGQYRNIEVIGIGQRKFNNVAIKFDSIYNKQNDSSRFLRMKAGASGSERTVYNFFDLQKGDYVFDYFQYDVVYKDGKFVTHHSSSSLPYYYDENGEQIQKVENVIHESGDNYRKIKIGKDHKFEGFLYKHPYSRGMEYTIYKDYDYENQEFINPICTFYGLAHVEYMGFDGKDGETFYIDTSESGNFPSYSWSNPASEFGSRLVDKVLENSLGDLFLYVTPSGNLAYFTTDELKEHIILSGDSPKHMRIRQTSITDYKLKDIFINISKNEYGDRSIVVNLKGDTIYESDGILMYVSYEDIFKKNGILKTTKNDETVFVQYKDGKITDIDLNGVIPYHIESRDNILYITDKKDMYIHKYNENMKCIDDDNLIEQKITSRSNSYSSDYGFVQYDKTTKTYKVSTSEHGFDTGDFFELLLNGEPYKPHDLYVISSHGNRNYHNNTYIAFIGSRYIDGGLKKTLFISDQLNLLDPSNPRKGRKLFTFGEYDDILCTDEYERENYFYVGERKSGYEENRIFVTDGDKETTYSLTLTKEGTLKTIKKKARRNE